LVRPRSPVDSATAAGSVRLAGRRPRTPGSGDGGARRDARHRPGAGGLRGGDAGSAGGHHVLGDRDRADHPAGDAGGLGHRRPPARGNGGHPLVRQGTAGGVERAAGGAGGGTGAVGSAAPADSGPGPGTVEDSMSYQGGTLLAEVVRSGFVEGRVHGSVVVCDGEGQVVGSDGEVTSPVFARSANKPMQAVGMLRTGLVLTDPADLALVCASHWGQDFHINRVQTMLHSVGLAETHLRCPPALPLDPEAVAAVYRAGGGPSRVLMNCSGKHAGMLLTCRAA